MKKVSIKPITVTIYPSFKENDEAYFQWGVLTNPRLVSNTEEGVTIGYLKEEQSNDMINTQVMRLFACNIVRDLFINSGVVNSPISKDIKLDLPTEVKEYLAKGVEILTQEIVNEIIYENDPLKPTKSKLDSLSLIPKQANQKNEQEGIETTE